MGNTNAFSIPNTLQALVAVTVSDCRGGSVHDDEDLRNSLMSTEIKAVFCFNIFSRICTRVLKDG